MESQFDALAGLYEDMAQWPFRRFIETPNVFAALGGLDGRDVLDFGCGSGTYSRWLKARGARRVVGYDVSEGMLDHARRREQKERLGIEYASALDAGLEGGFDLVLAVYVLPYATSREELDAMCASMARALRPGGRLVALPIHPEYVRDRDYYAPYGFRMAPDGPDVDGGRVRLELCRPPHDARVTAHVWSRETLESAMRRAGFAPVQWIGHGLPGDDAGAAEVASMQAYWRRPHAALMNCQR